MPGAGGGELASRYIESAAVVIIHIRYDIRGREIDSGLSLGCGECAHTTCDTTYQCAYVYVSVIDIGAHYFCAKICGASSAWAVIECRSWRRAAFSGVVGIVVVSVWWTVIDSINVAWFFVGLGLLGSAVAVLIPSKGGTR